MNRVFYYLSFFVLFAFSVLISASYKDRNDLVRKNQRGKYIPTSKLNLGSKKLKVSLWAATPKLFAPITMDIDAKGRVWVVEGTNYGRKHVRKGNFSIVVLEDTNKDGKADTSHKFITDNYRVAPLGIAVFDNKIVLSATPHIVVYTDVNRNAVYDRGDKKQVFLTGFKGGASDHGLHAVVGAPNGQWYFSHGNMGLDVRDKNKRRFIAGSYYGSPQYIGRKSSDGHTYVGGVAFRINPDGRNLNVVGSNLRNTHDMFVNSMGDIFQNDNDDPGNCRNSWLMEYGKLGYADLKDGARSWEEIARPWNKKVVRSYIHSRNSYYSLDHWRSLYPGSLPPDDVYGSGSPTGNYFIEGDELGKELRGTYLSADIVERGIFSYKPKLVDAQISMGKKEFFLKLGEKSSKSFFFPTDISVAPDGSVFICDFYNDTTRRVTNVSGSIYRVYRKGKKRYRLPKVDLDTIEGLLNVLKSPNASIRWVAFHKLKAKGDSAVDSLIKFYNAEENPYIKVRALWLLAANSEGKKFVEKLLFNSKSAQIRIVAYRALRFFQKEDLLSYADVASEDSSPSVRREVLLSLRDVPFEKKKKLLRTLIKSYDGKNRWYLEAIGYASELEEKRVYDEVIKPLFVMKSYKKWTDQAKNLAWRMYTPNSLRDLSKVIFKQKPEVKEFNHLLMAFALFYNDKQRIENRKTVEKFIKIPEFKSQEYQKLMRAVLDRDLLKLKSSPLTKNYIIPKSFGKSTKLSSVKRIASMSGNKSRGKNKIGVCYTCHRINDTGVSFGPDLSSWGRSRSMTEIVEAIVNPSAKLAHGYDKSVRVVSQNKKHVAEGLLANYSHHAGRVKIKYLGGKFVSIAFRKHPKSKINYLKGSLMPSASKMGLTNQNVRDIAEYLKSL